MTRALPRNYLALYCVSGITRVPKHLLHLPSMTGPFQTSLVLGLPGTSSTLGCLVTKHFANAKILVNHTQEDV